MSPIIPVKKTSSPVVKNWLTAILFGKFSFYGSENTPIGFQIIFYPRKVYYEFWLLRSILRLFLTVESLHMGYYSIRIQTLESGGC